MGWPTVTANLEHRGCWVFKLCRFHQNHLECERQRFHTMDGELTSTISSNVFKWWILPQVLELVLVARNSTWAEIINAQHEGVRVKSAVVWFAGSVGSCRKCNNFTVLFEKCNKPSCHVDVQLRIHPLQLTHRLCDSKLNCSSSWEPILVWMNYVWLTYYHHEYMMGQILEYPSSLTCISSLIEHLFHVSWWQTQCWILMSQL